MRLSIGLVLIATFSSSWALWGGKGSEVIDLTLHKDVKRMKNSPYAWALALYRDGCGYCELLKPEWTAAAAKMRKMAGVAAVDVVTHQHIAQSLMKDYGFEVKGVPTVIILKPGPDGKKELVQYSGERKTSPIVKALGAAMPEFVARITEPSFDSWQQKPGAKVVLFSKKREPSPQLKALSTKYRDRNVSFGIVDETDAKLRSLFSVNSYPKLFAIEAGRRVGKESYSPVEYTRGNSFVSLDFFVMDFASDKPSSSTESKKGDSKSEKSKPNKGNSKKSKPEKSSSPKKSKTKKPPPPPPKKSTSSKRRNPTLNGQLRQLPQPPNPIKLKGTDITKLSVKQLRGILARWDDPCSSCLEKSIFIERIKKHRKVYGDMENVAQHYAKKAQAEERRKKKKKMREAEKQESADASSNGSTEDDPFCTRMIEVETGALKEKLEELEAENAELRRQLDLVGKPLIHEDL
eukprot:m.60670 g.60670  ORF g.60670 m.60670 type:complete len:463 (-) comp9518_c0_seq2:2369-3757(-)